MLGFIAFVPLFSGPAVEALLLPEVGVGHFAVDSGSDRSFPLFNFQHHWKLFQYSG